MNEITVHQLALNFRFSKKAKICLNLLLRFLDSEKLSLMETKMSKDTNFIHCFEHKLKSRIHFDI